MSIRVQGWLLLALAFVSMLCVWRASGQVVIKKVCHHHAPTADYVELGNCIVYATGIKVGEVEESTRMHNGVEERCFTVQNALINDAECKTMVKTINGDTNKYGYRLTIENTKPHTIVFRFAYKPEQCVISYKYIESIQHEKGIAFNVYNRSLMQLLKKQHSPIIRTVSLDHKPIIVLDPGHGGLDSGAIDDEGTTEKDICLAVARDVQTCLTHEGYTVFLSRIDDRDVALDVRTQMARASHADLMVSLHANSSPNFEASGIEFFFLDPQYMHEHQGIDASWYMICKELMKQRLVYSKKLAAALEKSVLEVCARYKVGCRTRGVKTAVSQILVGSCTPTALIELGFLTNVDEAKRLRTRQYQKILAAGIASGIHAYCLNVYL